MYRTCHPSVSRRHVINTMAPLHCAMAHTKTTETFMFNIIFKLYARIIRSIIRATSAPMVANFALPHLRGRIIGKDADQDIPMIVLQNYRVWDYSMEGIVVQTADSQIWLDRSGMPEHVWLATLDWIIKRQAH